MANENTYLRGWWDTNAHISAILKADSFLSTLVFRRHLGSEDLSNANTEIVTAAITIFCNARYPAHNLAIRPREYVEALVIGEMMAPVLPMRMTLQQVHAQAEFMMVMSYLTTNPTVYTRGRTVDSWISELTEANEELDDNDRIPLPDPAHMVFEDYVAYLIWLAIKLPATQCMSPVQLVVTSYIGVAKRGTMSDRYVSKVVDGVRDDLGITVTLEPDTVKSTYVNFGRYMNATDAQQVFERWLNAIPEHALRLRLSLEQVSGSGLTAYIIIGRAFRKYNDCVG